jgi:hypothetical protein
LSFGGEARLKYELYVFEDFVAQSQPTQRSGNYVSAVATFRF